MRSLVIVLLLTRIALGEVREVPGQYATIQAAIDAASDGDVVRIAPGEYLGFHSLNGKAIELRSWDPTDPNIVRSTVLNRTTGTSLRMDSRTGVAKLCGFTVTSNGRLARAGVEVWSRSLAEINQCRFVRNRSDS